MGCPPFSTALRLALPPASFRLHVPARPGDIMPRATRHKAHIRGNGIAGRAARARRAPAPLEPRQAAASGSLGDRGRARAPCPRRVASQGVHALLSTPPPPVPKGSPFPPRAGRARRTPLCSSPSSYPTSPKRKRERGTPCNKRGQRSAASCSLWHRCVRPPLLRPRSSARRRGPALSPIWRHGARSRRKTCAAVGKATLQTLLRRVQRSGAHFCNLPGAAASTRARRVRPALSMRGRDACAVARPHLVPPPTGPAQVAVAPQSVGSWARGSAAPAIRSALGRILMRWLASLPAACLLPRAQRGAAKPWGAGPGAPRGAAPRAPGPAPGRLSAAGAASLAAFVRRTSLLPPRFPCEGWERLFFWWLPSKSLCLAWVCF
ncbi:MAG: hypothetical protein J3K34DRAFT_438415 [Monoraphidium minutum]|nr:MAG: hypothetical protein J3K34DRAFT_438415 [Monoraphidium minutum]